MNQPVLEFDYHRSKGIPFWYWTMFINGDPVARSTDPAINEEICQAQILTVVQLIKSQEIITVTNRDTGDEYEIM